MHEEALGGCFQVVYLVSVLALLVGMIVFLVWVRRARRHAGDGTEGQTGEE